MRLGFGCVNLGSASSGRSWRDDVRLVELAVDEGVTLFDTADVYGSGASERILGHALRRRRADVVIATKAGYRFRPRTLAEQSARRTAVKVIGAVRRARAGDNGPALGASGGSYADQDFTPATLRAAVDGSLQRLRTDHVDVLQLHGPKQVLPDLFQQLDDLVAAGKVRRFGVGAESVDAAQEWIGVRGAAVVQLPFGVLDPEAAQTALPDAARRSTEVWARGVLGGGLLAAAVRDPGAVAGDPKGPLIVRLRELAAGAGIDLFRLATGYVREFVDVSAMLIGIGSPVHLKRNLELLAAPPLDAELIAALDAVLAEHRMTGHG
jgi:aryl-alcohol dehydrogenase-like predicted oxidoreductase